MMILTIISFLTSLIFVGVVCFLSYSKHEYYNSYRRHGYLIYTLTCVLMLAVRSKYLHLIPKDLGFYLPLCLSLMFNAINIYCFGWLRDHMIRASRFRDLSNNKFKDAELLTFEGLRLGVVSGLKNAGLENTRKVYDKGSKMVWETKMNPGEFTRDYVGDFHKNIVVFGGVVEVYYESGEIEKLKRLDQINIRPYEVHKIKCLDKCKLIVTLIE